MKKKVISSMINSNQNESIMFDLYYSEWEEGHDIPKWYEADIGMFITTFCQNSDCITNKCINNKGAIVINYGFGSFNISQMLSYNLLFCTECFHKIESNNRTKVWVSNCECCLSQRTILKENKIFTQSIGNIPVQILSNDQIQFDEVQNKKKEGRCQGI